MIVKCIQLYNDNTKKYVEEDTMLVKGFHYNVLDISFSERGSVFRILPDDSGLYSGILVRSQDFEIITKKMPENWILFKRLSKISPEKWVNNDLWDESFWQDYFENKSGTAECFEEEVREIIKTDPEYIQTMIDERSDIQRFERWHETMMPLLKEIQSGAQREASF